MLVVRRHLPWAEKASLKPTITLRKGGIYLLRLQGARAGPRPHPRLQGGQGWIWTALWGSQASSPRQWRVSLVLMG